MVMQKVWQPGGIFLNKCLINENNLANFFQGVPQMQNLKQNGAYRFISLILTKRASTE